MRIRVIAALGAALLLAAPAAVAQVFTPTYQSPIPSRDIGIYLFDAPGGDLGVEGVLRRNFGRVSDLGLRIGFAETADDNTLLLGIDFRSPLQLRTDPLALALTVGAQAALLDAEAFGVQGGLSVGYAFRSPELGLTPYIHPRLVLVSANDDSDLDLEADVGLDISITPDLDIRFGFNLGHGADWGIGLAFRR